MDMTPSLFVVDAPAQMIGQGDAAAVIWIAKHPPHQRDKTASGAAFRGFMYGGTQRLEFSGNYQAKTTGYIPVKHLALRCLIQTAMIG